LLAINLTLQGTSLKFYLSLLLSFSFLFSANLNIDQREIKNEFDRVRQAQSINKHTDINLRTDSKNQSLSILLDENPCFKINEISLNDKGNSNFQKYLKKSLKELRFISGSCLGSKSINTIVATLNNKIVSHGFITSFASIESSNLKSGKLELALNLGKIDKISINNEDSVRNRASLFSAFGELEHNKTLNIRNLEQALENISNATLGTTDISISPSLKPGFSDVTILRKQKALPLSAYLSLDNSGSKATGRYQAQASINAVNLLGFNEIYTISLGKAVLNKEKTNLNSDSQKGDSRNRYFNFNIPFGYFNLSYTNSSYYYDQVIAGAYNLYSYSGRSISNNLALSYLFYRDQNLKSTVFLNLFRRASRNYVEEFELKNQRRVTAGYEIGVRSQLNLSNSQINGSISYKRGTGMLGALRAPEENIGEGTGRMKIWLLDLSYKHKLASNLTYDMILHAQYNKTPLTLQDRFSIGGLYSVRGFDGQMSLVGQKGLYIRNTLSYNYINDHSIYLALDGGAVYSATSKSEGSNKLAGTGLGIKGNFNFLGTSLNYDLSACVAIHKPRYFKTSDVYLSFRVGYGF